MVEIWQRLYVIRIPQRDTYFKLLQHRRQRGMLVSYARRLDRALWAAYTPRGGESLGAGEIIQKSVKKGDILEERSAAGADARLGVGNPVAYTPRRRAVSTPTKGPTVQQLTLLIPGCLSATWPCVEAARCSDEEDSAGEGFGELPRERDLLLHCTAAYARGSVEPQP